MCSWVTESGEWELTFFCYLTFIEAQSQETLLSDYIFFICLFCFSNPFVHVKFWQLQLYLYSLLDRKLCVFLFLTQVNYYLFYHILFQDLDCSQFAYKQILMHDNICQPVILTIWKKCKSKYHLSRQWLLVVKQP